MPRTPLRQAEPRIQDVPLPGLIECVTLQVNATLYRAGRTCRWVVILRDPLGNVELDRLMGTLQPDTPAAHMVLLEDLSAALASAEYQLHGTTNDLKEALRAETVSTERTPKPRKRAAAR
jgi:hypothetical protein